MSTGGFEAMDLLGLHATPMRDAPLVQSAGDAAALWQAGPQQGALALAGSRHSQGGHTVCAGGRMLLTPAFSAIAPPDLPRRRVTLEAGATWSQLHRVLAPLALAPWVHQSSPHFSIGGSLSVNCHGRDVLRGPVGNTVQSLRVLTGTGHVREATPHDNAELFAAVLGGYGGCGMVVQATLELAGNHTLQRVAYHERSLDDYAARVQQLAAQPGAAHMHHAWLNVSADGYLKELMTYDLLADSVDAPPALYAEPQLRHENWGLGELLRAGWNALRTDGAFRSHYWQQLQDPRHKGTASNSRLNWLRESTSFTATHGTPEAVDMLVEYFVPPANLPAFLDQLRAALPYRDGPPQPAHGAQLLSSTLRLVQPDVRTLLSYAPEARVSVALDLHVPLVPASAGAPLGMGAARGVPAPEVGKQMAALIEAALALGGSFYLPYWRFASRAQFERAYPRHAQWRAATRQHNPDRRFWNAFLAAYA